MPLALLGSLFALVAVTCSVFILLHAFRRSLGTGVMVLCIPCFMLYYAFSQFEHRRKDIIVSGWLACLVMAAVLYAFGAHGLIQAPPPSGFGG